MIADPSKELIDHYLENGTLYTAEANEEVIAAYVLNQTSPDVVEIKNIAVIPALQGRGIGRRAIKDAVLRAHSMGAVTLSVSTGNSSLSQLAFYQKCGFRIIGVERDFFIRHYPETILENGIVCRDRILLERDIRL
jgi:ribosomal protein S18 acetylase RimI-like enzyme